MDVKSESSVPPPQRALVLDLWDTLTLTVPSSDARDQLTAEVGAMLGVDPSRFAETYAATFPQRCRGELGDLRATLRSVCEMVGVLPADAAVEAAAKRRLEIIAELMQFRDEALPTLTRFRRSGWLVGVVTDSAVESEAVWSATAVSALVDVAVFSCSEGVSKPARELFEAVAQRLGVSPTDCAYVADGRTGELAAASSLGMRAVRLAIEIEYSDAEVWHGETVDRLSDLTDLLLENPSDS